MCMCTLWKTERKRTLRKSLLLQKTFAILSSAQLLKPPFWRDFPQCLFRSQTMMQQNRSASRRMRLVKGLHPDQVTHERSQELIPVLGAQRLFPSARSDGARRLPGAATALGPPSKKAGAAGARLRGRCGVTWLWFCLRRACFPCVCLFP